jgi:hypothetical protein
MGGSQSQEVKTMTNIMSENITNVIQKNASSAQAKLSAVNQIKVSFKGSKLINCPIQGAQKIQASQSLKSVANMTSKADIAAVLKAAIDKTTEASSKQVNDFLNVSFANNNQKVTNNTNIINTIKTNIEQINVDEVLATLKGLNQGEWDFSGAEIDCKGKPINISQKNILDQVVTKMTDAVGEAVVKSQQDLGIKETLKVKAEQENKGATDLIKAFTGPLAIIAIAFVAFIALGGTKVFSSGTALLSDPKKMIMIALGIAVLIAIIWGISKARSSGKKEFYGDCERYEYYVEEPYGYYSDDTEGFQFYSGEPSDEGFFFAETDECKLNPSKCTF